MNRASQVYCLSPALTVPWIDLMKQKVHGVVNAEGRQYTWMARFIGPDLFVYATESANATFEDKGFQFPFFGIYEK